MPPSEKPASPVKESNKLTEGMKTPSFSDEDGILAWRGLVTSNEKSLGCVSLLTGHKLGLNFWKSYLDVSRKMPLKQLSLMLPGDAKSAWKSPLLYRNHVLSLCTMKPAPRQPNEKFTNFTRHLAIKAKAAGVLCIDSFTSLFLVPSSKLAIRLGFCTAEKPPRMFCIVCRRHSSLLFPTSALPQASPATSPPGSRSAPASHTGITAETVTAAVRPASLDLKAQHKAKIVVSSPENNFPKRTHPRHIAKRSLSFPFSPVKDYNKRSLRISRSASTSARDGFRDGNSELKPPTPDRFLELQTNCNGSSRAREFEQYSCPGSQLKLSMSTHDASKKNVAMKQSQLTPPTAKEACHENSCTEKKLSSSVTGGGKYDASFSSISLTKNESPVKSPAACVIPSPSSGGLSPFWPDSPIVFSSGSDKSPFLYDAPSKKDERTEGKRRLPANSGDNWRVNLSQSRDELSGKMTRQLTKRDEEADSTPRMLMGRPFRASEEKTPDGTKLHLENWNTTSSFLSDKQALHSLRKAAALQKGSKLHNSTESRDDLQTIDMEISEPSNTDSSNLTNMGADDSLDKVAMRSRLLQVHDDLQTVDMEISEPSECPIILSHAFSCAPSVPLHDCSSSYPIQLASGITPVAGGLHSGGSITKHAHDSLESSLPSNTAKISELSLSAFNDSGNSRKEDVRNSLEHDEVDNEMSLAPNERAFAMGSITLNVHMYPKASESGDIVEPVDMDITDDVELLSNTFEFEDDRPTTKKTAGVLDDYNANSGVERFSPKELANDPIENKGSLGTGCYLSKQHVSGTSEDRVLEVVENAASGITTDHSNDKLTSNKRSYSSLTSSSEQDIDARVLNPLQQKPKHVSSEDATQMTCSPLPSKKNPSTCSITNRKAIGFSLSPKKSTKVIARLLKTLQNTFAVKTNCDQPSLCKSNDLRSTELSSVKSSPLKSTTDQSNDCISRINSDDFATMDESRDCKPLAVSCTAFERDDTDFPEHAGSHLGGVIETSLFQDWGVTEDSLISADHDGSTEVYDFVSQADQPVEPIETWPVIDDGDFPDPEIVVCSPLNSIETFTFRFPGESGFDEDEDEVIPRETKTTEEETILVEERFLGFFMGPEVVICSDGNTEAIVTPSEELESAAFPPEKNNDEATSREELKTKGFEGEDLNIAECSRPVDRQCARTESCMEGCSEKLSQSLASQSLSKDEPLIQSEQSVVSQEVDPVKGGDASPEVPETEIPCPEKLNTTLSGCMKSVENLSIPKTVPQLEEPPCEGDHSSETRGVKTSPGNEEKQRLETVKRPGKLTCAAEVNMSNRLGGNRTERGEKETLLYPTDFPEVVHGKTHRDNSIERVQALNIPNGLPDTRVDPQQEKKLPGCEEPITLPKTRITDNGEVKRSSDKTQSTAALNEGVTSTTLSYPSPPQSSSKLQCSGVNEPTDYTSTKHLPLKPVESNAKIVTDGKPVEETIRTVQCSGVTVSQPRLYSNPEIDSQRGKTGERHCDRDCRGKNEPLKDINDLQRDHRVLNGKRKLVTEPENMAKQLKLSPEPPWVSLKSQEVDFGDNRLYRHYTERGRSEYRQAEYGGQYPSPYWMAPSLPAHLPVRNGEWGGLPRVVPSDPPWYPPGGVTNQNRFEGVYPSSADFGRAIFAPIMYRARPMFSPPGTVPGTWQLPGNSCHVTYPLLGRR